MGGESPHASRAHPARWLWTVTGVALALAIALALTEPLPPRRVTMATGPEGGAYASVGPRYREIFARQGIRLELLATRGSVDNVERLRDPRSGVSVALVQGGTTSAATGPELVSLGTLFYEPLWLFSRIPPPSQPGKRREDVRLSFGVPEVSRSQSLTPGPTHPSLA